MRAVLYLFAFLVLVPAYGSPPNIVVYLADDVGIGEINQHAPEFSLIDDKAELARMEQYPQARRIQTPTLERLAREGKRFMRSYAGSSVCSPSRHSLLTGIQVGMAKTRGNGFGPNGSSDVDIEPGRSTFGEIVKSVGYATAAFGKWGAATGSDTSGSPCKHGFDYFFGMFAHTQIGHAFPKEIYSCRAETSGFSTHEYKNNEDSSVEKCRGEGNCTYFDFEVRAKALEYIDQASTTTPFLVYWATYAGHSALYEQVNKFGSCHLKTHPVPSMGRYTKQALMTTGRNTAEIRGHMAMIEYTIDEDLRLLLAKLEAKGIAEKTLIIFASDNGPHREAFKDPEYTPADIYASGGLKGIKRSTYEGGTRIPTIAWWPGTIPPNTKSHYPFMLYDIPLTIASAAGVPPNAPVLEPFKVANAGGVSLFRLMKSKRDSVVSSKTRPWVYTEICYARVGNQRDGQVCPVQWSPATGCAYALYDLKAWPKAIWKLVKNLPNAQEELYDVLNDPGEKRNRVWNRKRGAILRRARIARAKIRTSLCDIEHSTNPSCFADRCNYWKTRRGCRKAKCKHFRRKRKGYTCHSFRRRGRDLS